MCLLGGFQQHTKVENTGLRGRKGKRTCVQGYWGIIQQQNNRKELDRKPEKYRAVRQKRKRTCEQGYMG